MAPLSRILTQEASRFTLQSNIDTSFHLSNASIYLSPGSEMVLLLIDAGADLSEDLTRLNNRSKVGFTSGEILILRTAGSWIYQVDLDFASVSVIGSGRGAVGVADLPSGTEVDCLIGICELTSEEDVSFVLQAGQRISILDQGLSEKETTPTETTAKWNKLCGNCLGE